MPTIEDLLSRIDGLEDRIKTLEDNDAARRDAAKRAIAAVADRRAAAEADAQARAAAEREAVLQRRAARASQQPPSADAVRTVRLGGLAASALAPDGKPIEIDGVSVSVDGKAVTAAGNEAAITSLARKVFDDGGEPGRRAAKAIYAGMRLPMPRWLQGAPR